MNDLVEKLKTLKNATQEQYQDIIEKYAYNEVIKMLKEAGISKDDISQNEFDDLLRDKIAQANSFSKGAMIASGALLFLDLLG